MHRPPPQQLFVYDLAGPAMSDGRSYSAVTIAMVVFKGLVWAGLAFGALTLVIFVFNLAPYALAPFYTSWPQRWPGGIEGKVSDAELRRRVKALRALTASPQAAANSASSLTVIGVQFDRLRDDAAKQAVGPKTDAISQPYPVKLDLSNSNRGAVVVLADQAIAWGVIPPAAGRPQALFAIESRLPSAQ
jgi:hypothetical protein